MNEKNSEKINTLHDNNNNDLDTDEEALFEVYSDEALEATASGFGGLSTTCSFFSAPCC